MRHGRLTLRSLLTTAILTPSPLNFSWYHQEGTALICITTDKLDHSREHRCPNLSLLLLRYREGQKKSMVRHILATSLTTEYNLFFAFAR